MHYCKQLYIYIWQSQSPYTIPISMCHINNHKYNGLYLYLNLSTNTMKNKIHDTQVLNNLPQKLCTYANIILHCSQLTCGHLSVIIHLRKKVLNLDTQIHVHFVKKSLFCKIYSEVSSGQSYFSIFLNLSQSIVFQMLENLMRSKFNRKMCQKKLMNIAYSFE